MFPASATSFSELFTNPQLAIYFSISILNAVLFLCMSVKFILVLQLGGYKGKKYFKWLASPETPYLSRLMLLCLLGLLFFCLLSTCFSFLGVEIASYVGFLSYILFSILYITTEKKMGNKVRLSYTKRVIRLFIVYFFVVIAFTFGLITLINFLAFTIKDEVVGIMRYSIICATPLLAPYLLYVASLIVAPFELMVKKYYVKKATLKLKRSQVLKIGISGSFGKTTVKEILKSILSQKYRVLATPDSYNTPLGIALTVNNLDSTHDIFIAEMGARNKGDIKEVAKIVNPMYGVLTGVNSQHLESFGSMENIKDTKYELFENLTDGGEGFFCSDNKNALELSERFKGEKYFAGTGDYENNLVWATDIVTDWHGTSFNLCIKGEEPVRCATVLLGEHSIRNICLAAAVAYKIGMTAKEIAFGIIRIQSVGHRLEIMPNNKGIVIIDDSYNANIDGAEAAMQVLDMFDGRKIVVTPGLVELGKEENALNIEYGKMLAKHADKVIIVGRHNAEMILSGLIDGGMKKEDIRFAKNLNRGNTELNKMLKAGDIVLFENDLPDNYN